MDIPEDVMKAARQCAVMMEHPSKEACGRNIDAIARAIMAERERCAVVCDEWNGMKHVAYDLEFNGKLFPKNHPCMKRLPLPFATERSHDPTITYHPH